MTNEQRIDRLEREVFGTPTLERQFSTDFNTRPFTAYDIADRDAYDRITKVIRKNDNEGFRIGAKARIADLPYNLTIESFTETQTNLFVNMVRPGWSTTVPLSDVVALTTGGASADWVANHGVKEWEITAFRRTAKPGFNAQGEIRNPPAEHIQHYLDTGQSVKSGHWEIYEVKRLSDGSVWKLGDEFSTNIDGKSTIEHFRISGNFMLIICPIGNIYLSGLIKPALSGKQWEIVEFRKPGSDWGYSLKNGRYGVYEKWSFENMLHEGPYSLDGGGLYIHSVRRLSDGEVFTIDDRINFPNRQHSPGGCIIKHFTISDGEIFVNNHMNGSPDMRIKDWIKWQDRKPLFRTADGVDVYDRDTIWYLNYDTGEIAEERNPNKYCTPHRHFSTKAAAEKAYEVWLYDQPALTLKEVYQWYCADQTFEHIVNVVKEKLAK